jgi:hypothetical protein
VNLVEYCSAEKTLAKHNHVSGFSQAQRRIRGVLSPHLLCIARILVFLAFFNFFLYSVDRWAAAPSSHAGNGAGCAWIGLAGSPLPD